MADKLHFKILLVGDPGVGKTSILNRFVDDTFSDDTVPTLGDSAQIKTRTLEISGKTITLQIRDTDGQERFGNITCSLFMGMDGIIVTYDVSIDSSFAAVESWISETNRYAKKDVHVIIVGNKTDLGRAVSAEQGKQVADSNNFPYAESSAKTGEGVEDIFVTLCQAMLSRLQAKAEAKPVASTLSLDSPGEPLVEKKNKKCSLF